MYKCLAQGTETGVRALFYNPQDLKENFLMEWDYEELSDGVIEAVCHECGASISVEPDATTGYCNNCERSSKVFNPAVWLIGVTIRRGDIK